MFDTRDQCDLVSVAMLMTKFHRLLSCLSAAWKGEFNALARQSHSGRSRLR